MARGGSVQEYVYPHCVDSTQFKHSSGVNDGDVAPPQGRGQRLVLLLETAAGHQVAGHPHNSTVLIRDSTIRNVRVRGACTICFLATKVLDIADKIPGAIYSHPEVHRIIIHVGTNDIPRKQAEVFKLGFAGLFATLKLLKLYLWTTSLH